MSGGDFIKKLDLQEVKNLLVNGEYLVIQGCGGDLKEWEDGMTDMLKEFDIIPSDFHFKNVYSFENENLTNMLFSLNDDRIDIGKLAMFRLKTREDLGAMWLSDYVNNYLNDIKI